MSKASTKHKQNDITSLQVKRIHIAKQQLGLHEENYRDILSGFNNKDGKPCSSCKELSEKQADILINEVFIKRLSWKEKRKYKESKYSKFSGRDSKFATVVQLELIDKLWYNNINVREKNDKALNSFISNITKVDDISFLLKKDVSKVIKAISSISARLNEEEKSLDEESNI